MYELKWRFEFNSEVKEAIFVASKYPEAVELFKKNSTNGSRPNENTDPAVNREHSKIDAFKTNRIETVRNDDTLKHSEAVIGLSFKESTDTALDIEIHDSHTSGTKKNENVFFLFVSLERRKVQWNDKKGRRKCSLFFLFFAFLF